LDIRSEVALLIIKVLPSRTFHVTENSSPMSRFKNWTVVAKQGVQLPGGRQIVPDERDESDSGCVLGTMFRQALEMNNQQILPVV
jgi:hypothetical protein